MRTAPPEPDEIDAWMTVLVRHGHVHEATSAPGPSWTVRRTAADPFRTFHDPGNALDFVADVLRSVRQEAVGTPR